MTEDHDCSVYVDLSPEVEAVLADNGISLAELLQSDGIAIKQTFASPPLGEDDSNEKDAVLVLLASSALIVSLTPTIARLLELLSRKSVVVEETVLVPVEDSNGHVIRSTKGEPVVRRIKKSRYLETADQVEQRKLEIRGFGITIKFESKPKGEAK